MASNGNPWPARTRVDAADLHRIWMTKVDLSRWRLRLMEKGRMAPPDIPSADFTYIRDAIVYATKPYDYSDEVEPSDAYLATAFSMASPQTQVPDYLHSHALSSYI